MNETLFIDFLHVKEILWAGIDFSKAKFTRQGFDFPQEILHRYFNDWNTVILSDQKKYDIRLSFRKPVMQYDLSAVTKINKSVKPAQILVQHLDIKYLLSDEMVCAYSANLSLPAELEYALTFLVESFDSITKMAAIWVVIVQTSTKQVVLCEKFLKQPNGLGLRSYWARTFYNLLYDVRTYAFLRWENMVQDTVDAKATATENNEITT